MKTKAKLLRVLDCESCPCCIIADEGPNKSEWICTRKNNRKLPRIAIYPRDVHRLGPVKFPTWCPLKDE